MLLPVIRYRAKVELNTTGWELDLVWIPENTLLSEIGKMAQLSIKMMERRTLGTIPRRKHHLDAHHVFDIKGTGVIINTDGAPPCDLRECLLALHVWVLTTIYRRR